MNLRELYRKLPAPEGEEWRYTKLKKEEFPESAGRESVDVDVNAENVSFAKKRFSLPTPGDKVQAFTQAFGQPLVFKAEGKGRARSKVKLGGAGALVQKVEVGAFAQLDFFERYAGSGFFGQESVFNVAEGAVLNYYAVQGFSAKTLSFVKRDFRLAEGARVNVVIVEDGGRVSRHANEFVLNKSAEARYRACFSGAGEQHFDSAVRSLHEAEGAKSGVLVKGVLDGGASSVFRGVVKIGRKAKASESRVVERVLHLSERAESHSIPSMFIDNNDVKASHGAAVSKVSEEELFYLQSRGLERKKAEKLVVEGFLREVRNAVTERG